MDTKRILKVLFCLSFILFGCEAAQRFEGSVEFDAAYYFAYYWPYENDDSTYTFASFDKAGEIVQSETFKFNGDIANNSFFPSKGKIYMHAFGGLVEYDIFKGKLSVLVSDDAVSHVFLSPNDSLYYIIQRPRTADEPLQFEFYEYNLETQRHVLLHTFNFVVTNYVVANEYVYVIESAFDQQQNRLYQYTLADFTLLDVKDVESSSHLGCVDEDVYLCESDSITDLGTNEVYTMIDPVIYTDQLLKYYDQALYSLEDPMSGTCTLRKNGETVRTFEQCDGYQDVAGDYIMIQLDKIYYRYDLSTDSLQQLELDDPNIDIHHTYIVNDLDM